MEISIPLQAAEILAALSLGVLLGFLYDLLRLPRRLFPGLGVLVDTAFCLVMAGGLFCLGMVCGGTLRYYMPFAAMLGACVYSALFGRWLRPALGRLEAVIGKKLESLKNILKNLYKNLKNIFSRLKKRFRMIGYNRNDKVGNGVSKSGAQGARRKGTRNENSQQEHSGKTYYPGPSGLRPFHDR